MAEQHTRYVEASTKSVYCRLTLVGNRRFVDSFRKTVAVTSEPDVISVTLLSRMELLPISKIQPKEEYVEAPSTIACAAGSSTSHETQITSYL